MENYEVKLGTERQNLRHTLDRMDGLKDQFLLAVIEYVTNHWKDQAYRCMVLQEPEVTNQLKDFKDLRNDINSLINRVESLVHLEFPGKNVWWHLLDIKDLEGDPKQMEYKCVQATGESPHLIGPPSLRMPLMRLLEHLPNLLCRYGYSKEVPIRGWPEELAGLTEGYALHKAEAEKHLQAIKDLRFKEQQDLAKKRWDSAV